MSMERTEQKPPERSLIEQEGYLISPIQTDTNGTQDVFKST